jgi:hypothetical protein
VGWSLSVSAWAQTDGRLRIGGDAGLGIAQVQVSGSKRTEKPGTFAVQIDYALRSYLVVGVEHYRTLVNDNGPSSGVGFTGVFGKYYLFSTRAPVMPEDAHISQDEIIIKALSPYVGLSAGIGQASLRSLNESQGENRSLSVGSYIGGKVGFEYPIRHPWTTYLEGGAAATVVGTGTIIFVRVGAGLLYNF